MAENKLIEQAKTFYGKLAAWQKIMLIAVPSLIVIGMSFLLVNSKQPDLGVLYSNLEAKDAGKIVENLKTKNIEYQLKDNGSTILVDKKKLYDLRLSLASEGLPEQSTVGYELFDKANLIK